MRADEFATRLRKSKRKTFKNGDEGFIGSCPCERHKSGDNSLSLAFGEGENGWIWIKCQGGCSQEEVLSALGLKNDDLKTEDRSKSNSPTAVYKYTDATGKYLFEKQRFDLGNGKKTFKLKSRDESGHVTHDLHHLNGWSGTLYNWPAVVKAIEKGETVYLNEGEKACDRLIREGIVATCQPLGADAKAPESKWKDAHTQALAGANVVIIADIDEAGEAYSRYVASQLKRVCKSVKVVQSKTEKPKHDVWDHLSAGFKVEELTEVPRLMSNRRSTWKTASEIQVKQTEWLVDPYFAIGELNLLAGDPGVGKSQVARALAAAISCGGTFFGKKMEKGRVIILSAEDSISRVIVPQLKELGANLENILLMDDEDDDGKPNPFMLNSAGIAELDEVAKEYLPRVIIVDTIAAYFESARDFNKTNEVREWMRRLQEVGRHARAAVIPIGHTNKSSNSKAIYKIAGSLDFVAASRSVMLCGMNPDNPSDRAVVHVKSNIGPLGAPQGYSVEGGIFGCTGISTLTYDKFDAQKESVAETRKADSAKAWLMEFLSDGGKNSAIVYAEGADAGFKKNAIMDAKDLLSITPRRVGGIGASGYWVWELPGHTQEGKDYDPWQD